MTTISNVEPITHRGRVINTNTLLNQYKEAVFSTTATIQKLIKEGKPYNRDQILARFLVGVGDPFNILNAVYSNGKLIQSVITPSSSNITNPQYAEGIGQGGAGFVALSTNVDLNINASTLPPANGVACGDEVDTRDSLFAPVDIVNCLCIKNSGKNPAKENLYTQQRRVNRNSKSAYILSKAKETVELQIQYAIRNGQPYDKDALYTAAIVGAFKFLKPNWNEVITPFVSTVSTPGSSTIVTDNQKLNITDVTDKLLRNQRLNYKNQNIVINAKAREAALARYNKAIQDGIIPDVPPPNAIFDQYLEEANRRADPIPTPQETLIPTTTADRPGNMAVRRYNVQKRTALQARAKIVNAAVAARTLARQTWQTYLNNSTPANLAIANVALLKAQNATKIAFETQRWRPPPGDSSLER